MAHEFETGFVAERPSWHGLEDFSDELLTSADAIKRSGLDWMVELAPMFARLGNGTEISDPGHNLVIRNSDLAVVGRDKSDRFHLVQPADLFATGEKVFANGEARCSSALSLRNGSVVTVNYKLDNAAIMDAIGSGLKLDDKIDWYLTLAVSYDGSIGWIGAATGTRVECMNTLVGGLAGAVRSWKVKLTAGAAGQIELAESSMQNVFAYARTFTETAARLRDVNITAGQFDAFAEQIYQTRDKLPAGQSADKVNGIRQLALKQSWRDTPTLDGIRDTAWGAFNGVSEFDEWLQPTRASERSDVERFFDGFIFDGDSAKLQTRALDILTGQFLDSDAVKVATKGKSKKSLTV